MGEPVRTPQEADPEGEQLLTFNRACAADARAGNGAEPGPPAKRKEGTRTVRGGLIMGQSARNEPGRRRRRRRHAREPKLAQAQAQADRAGCKQSQAQAGIMDASRWRCELRSRLNHGKANVPDTGTPALALAVGGIGITSPLALLC
jgi:hypothetical protein